MFDEDKKYIIPIAEFEKLEAQRRYIRQYKSTQVLRPLPTTSFPYNLFDLLKINVESYAVTDMVVTLVDKNVHVEWKNPTNVIYDFFKIEYSVNGSHYKSHTFYNNEEEYLIDEWNVYLGDRIDILFTFYSSEVYRYDYGNIHFDTSGLHFDISARMKEFDNDNLSFNGEWNYDKLELIPMYGTGSLYSGVVEYSTVENDKYDVFRARSGMDRETFEYNLDLTYNNTDPDRALKRCEAFTRYGNLYLYWELPRDIEQVIIHYNYLDGNPAATIVKNVGKTNIYKIRQLGEDHYEFRFALELIDKDGNSILSLFNSCEVIIDRVSKDPCEPVINRLPEHLQSEGNLLHEYACLLGTGSDSIDKGSFIGNPEYITLRDMPNTREIRSIYDVTDLSTLKTLLNFKGTITDFKYMQKVAHYSLELQERSFQDWMLPCKVGSLTEIDLDDPNFEGIIEVGLDVPKLLRQLLQDRLHICIDNEWFKISAKAEDEYHYEVEEDLVIEIHKFNEVIYPIQHHCRAIRYDREGQWYDINLIYDYEWNMDTEMYEECGIPPDNEDEYIVDVLESDGKVTWTTEIAFVYDSPARDLIYSDEGFVFDTRYGHKIPANFDQGVLVYGDTY